MNMCAKLNSNLSTNYGDIASGDTGANGLPKEQPENTMPSAIRLSAEAQSQRDRRSVWCKTCKADRCLCTVTLRCGASPDHPSYVSRATATLS